MTQSCWFAVVLNLLNFSHPLRKKFSRGISVCGHIKFSWCKNPAHSHEYPKCRQLADWVLRKIKKSSKFYIWRNGISKQAKQTKRIGSDKQLLKILQTLQSLLQLVTSLGKDTRVLTFQIINIFCSSCFCCRINISKIYLVYRDWILVSRDKNKLLFVRITV